MTSVRSQKYQRTGRDSAFICSVANHWLTTAPVRRAILGLALSLTPLVAAYPPSIKHATILERQVQVQDSYNYVIVGGGTAGLTVGDRLTEDCDSADSLFLILMASFLGIRLIDLLTSCYSYCLGDRAWHSGQVTARHLRHLTVSN